MQKKVPNSCLTTAQCANPNVPCDMCAVPTEDVEVMTKIKAITARGNDAEVRRKKDGKYAVYEIKKHVI